MLLTLDAGNTHVVMGVFGAGAPGASPKADGDAEPTHVLRFATHPVGTADELRARIQALLALHDLSLSPGAPASSRVQAVVLASVVPALTAVAREALPGVHVVDSSWPFSFPIRTREPARTGIDRLVNAEAVWGLVPAIVVDLGTTTTICAVTPDGFWGGAILPGLEASRHAVVSRGAQLFDVPREIPECAIGRDTTEALQSGIFLGYQLMIESMIERFRAELAPLKPRVIATGGLSGVLGSWGTAFDAIDPHLTLKGMAQLFWAQGRKQQG